MYRELADHYFCLKLTICCQHMNFLSKFLHLKKDNDNTIYLFIFFSYDSDSLTIILSSLCKQLNEM